MLKSNTPNNSTNLNLWKTARFNDPNQKNSNEEENEKIVYFSKKVKYLFLIHSSSINYKKL